MKTITSITYPVFALFAFACFSAGAGVLGAESIDEGLNLPVQSDTVNVSPELAGHETQTVIGLYNSSTHETRIWYMNNNVHVGTVASPRLPARWSPVAAADFNGDGHIDVLFFNPTTGRTWIGYLFAGTLTGAYGPTLPSGWYLVGTADFNHDGHPDFLLLDSGTGATSIWYMNNNVHIRTTLLQARLGWHRPLLALADFNGDGNPDWLLVYTVQSPPGYYIWDKHNNVYEGVPPPPPGGWFFLGATDFNRNGRADILLYNFNTRQTAIWYMNNNVHVGTAAGPRIPSGYNLFAP